MASLSVVGGEGHAWMAGAPLRTECFKRRAQDDKLVGAAEVAKAWWRVAVV